MVVIFLLAGSSWARTDGPAEANKVLEQFFAGAMPLNAAVNRIQFLGMERLAAQELVLQLRRSPSDRARGNVLEFLASLGVRDPDVDQVFLRYLGSTDLGEAMTSARGLGRSKCAAAVTPLTELLTHRASGLRREAGRALGEIGKPAATAPLLKAAKAEDELELRVLLISAAGRAGDKKQAKAFEALLDDGSEATRLAAAQALCLMGLPRCATFAGKLLASKSREVRFQGVMLFEGASMKTSGPLLTPLLDDADHRLRARAARILVQGGDAKRLDWLVLESVRAQGEARLAYEAELEKLRLTDEQRQAILKKAGL